MKIERLEIISGAPNLSGDLYKKGNDNLVELKEQYFKVDHTLTAESSMLSRPARATNLASRSTHASSQ